jgi:ATP-dependent Clp protease ATP-binding subunit ClpC
VICWWSYARGVFELFTDRARRVVVLAQEEARLLNHNYIGTEHILLGLVAESEGVAAQVLGQGGVTLAVTRAAVEGGVGRGPAAPTGHIPSTPRAKKTLELAWREGTHLGVTDSRPIGDAGQFYGRRARPRVRRRRRRRTEIGPEHMLLGLLREGEGIAVQVLDGLGIDRTELRQAVIDAIGEARDVEGTSDLPQPYGPQAGTIWSAEPIVRCPGCGIPIDLVAAPQKVQIRMERIDSPRFRVYLEFGDLPEHLVHECEPETSTP